MGGRTFFDFIPVLYTLLLKVLWHVAHYFLSLGTLYLCSIRNSDGDEWWNSLKGPTPYTTLFGLPLTIWGTQVLYLDFQTPLVPSISIVLSHDLFTLDVSFLGPLDVYQGKLISRLISCNVRTVLSWSPDCSLVCFPKFLWHEHECVPILITDKGVWPDVYEFYILRDPSRVSS